MCQSVRVVLDSNQHRALTMEPREYADAKVSDFAGGELRAARVKLKGSEGSYEPLFLRPCFTIKLASNEYAASFMGLRKFHLNNSRQDKSSLRDWLLGNPSRPAIGHPGGPGRPRAGGAERKATGLVRAQGGLERAVFDPNLWRWRGKFVRGHPIQGRPNRPEPHGGKRQPKGQDLAALAEACAPGATGDWRAAVEGVLNVDQFLAFAAFEFVAGQWDGYVRNLNKYPTLLIPPTGRAHFLLHGMDKALGPPAKAASAPCRGRVYRAVVSAREWEARSAPGYWTIHDGWRTDMADTGGASATCTRKAARDPAEPESGLPSLLQEFRLRSRFLQEELDYLQRTTAWGREACPTWREHP